MPATQRISPGPGQESVWDYPRPPRVEDVDARVRVLFGGVTIADTTRAKRVLETSHPPTFYLPPQDVQMQHLQRAASQSFCEWKGQAIYYDVIVDGQIARAAVWSYPNPTPGFVELRDYLSFYPSRMDACFVGEEEVQAQKGDFYGGWITSRIVGPFKGGPGTRGW